VIAAALKTLAKFGDDACLFLFLLRIDAVVVGDSASGSLDYFDRCPLKLSFAALARPGPDPISGAPCDGKAERLMCSAMAPRWDAAQAPRRRPPQQAHIGLKEGIASTHRWLESQLAQGERPRGFERASERAA
jgi:hypothetical protein